MRKANVVRSKQVRVDLSEFLHEYHRAADNSIVFKAAKLNSVTQQIEKVQALRLNKELGAIKRKITIASNKEAKVAEKNKKILQKYKEDEKNFQAERIKRIIALFAERLPMYGSGQDSQAHGSGQESQVHEFHCPYI